jgi:hypothetical protein
MKAFAQFLFGLFVAWSFVPLGYANFTWVDLVFLSIWSLIGFRI